MISTIRVPIGRIKRLLLQHEHSYGVLSLTLPICRGLQSSRHACQRQIYTFSLHRQIYTPPLIEVSPFLETKNTQRTRLDLFADTQKWFSSGASSEASITKANTATPADFASVDTERNSSTDQRQLKRKRRKRSKWLAQATSATPVTSNAKLTIMRVKKRRRKQGENTAESAIAKKHAKWNMNFKKFQSYIKEKAIYKNKRSSIQHGLPKDKSLRRWVTDMRYYYKKMLQGRKMSRLIKTKIKLVMKSGFKVLVTPMKLSWDARYDQLKQFLKKHNGKYPHEVRAESTLSSQEVALCIWCQKQRSLRQAFVNGRLSRGGMINEKRIELLDEIKFIWQIRKSTWLERYDRLKAYYNTHGNCLVTSSFDKQLKRWAEGQRRDWALLKQGKELSRLTPERIQLLDAIEFEWDPLEELWLAKYNELIEFQRLNGVLPTVKTNKSLYIWIQSQREHYQKWIAGEPSRMNEQRRDRLVAQGVVLSAYKRKGKTDMISKLKQQLKDMQ